MREGCGGLVGVRRCCPSSEGSYRALGLTAACLHCTHGGLQQMSSPWENACGVFMRTSHMHSFCGMDVKLLLSLGLLLQITL